MSAAIRRELSFTYNGLEVGGSSEKFQPTGYMRLGQGPEAASAEWEVLVSSESESGFKGAVEEFEDAMSVPWKALVIKQGDSKLVDVSPDDATALNPVPFIMKVGDPGDTGRTRIYRCRLEWGSPAAYNEESEGLRNYDVEVLTDPAGIRTVNIVGTYTAVDSTRARAQFDAKIDAFQTSVLTAIGSGTFEQVADQSTHDTNDAALSFRRTLIEVIFDQGGGGVDDSSIIGQVLQIATRTNTIEATSDDTFSTTPMADIVATYAATIDKDETTDLKSKWDDIEGFIIDEIASFFDGSVAVRSSEPRFFPDSNRIEATVVCMGVPVDTYVQARITWDDDHDFGMQLIHAWTGQPFSKFVYQGPGTYIRRIAIDVVKTGTHTKADAFAELEKVAGRESVDGVAPRTRNGGQPHTSPQSPGAGAWYPVKRHGHADAYSFGVPGLGGQTVDLTRLVAFTDRAWAVNAADITG